ncbi:hypothetical protein TWF192_001138 [Orbilia oligospora]|nr:hypothetical protein TWF191_006427 [Orbilia oligospora]KAF3234979.1 hypothetical protein TWF192_001138 [Orbilia oligospora]
MKYSPSGRRFSLPAFDIFGQPMFEPYPYYGQYHPYPPPPPPPPPPHQHHLHQHQHQHQHPLPYSHPHHGYQHPPEPYPYFNIPETLPEEYLIPSSPDTNPFSSTPTHHYNRSRETISPDCISSSSSGGGSCGDYTNSFIPYSPSSSSLSQPSLSLLSSSSSGGSPNSFPFAISIPSLDVSRTETPGQCHYGFETVDSMVVRTIPHPDTVQQQQHQENYDGPSSQARRKQSVPKVVNKYQQQHHHHHHHHHHQGGPGRALIVNGSTNDPIPPKTTQTQANTATVILERGNKEKGGQTVKTQETLPQKLNKGQQATTSVPAQSSVEQTKPAAVQENPITEELASSNSADEGESAYVHLTLNHLPHSNKLNMVRLRANYTATANKPNLIEEAKSIFTAALQSNEATNGVELGSWFSWTERGVNINFKTNTQRWIATENLDWLLDIGEGIRLNEKWGGIVVRDIWNPYILENTVPDDDNLKRKLEQLNVMSYGANEDGESVQEPYRIRKIRWFGPSTLAIWFHDTNIAEYFAQKGVWFMEGFVGIGKNKKVAVCGLPTVHRLLEQNRNRIVPQHIRRNGFVHPTAHKEGPGGQQGGNNREAK